MNDITLTRHGDTVTVPAEAASALERLGWTRTGPAVTGPDERIAELEAQLAEHEQLLNAAAEALDAKDARIAELEARVAELEAPPAKPTGKATAKPTDTKEA